MTCVVLTAPLIPIILIGIIPYALFKGITSERVWDEYLDIWNSFTNFLIHPYYKYMERKSHIEELKQRVDYYRKENDRLNRKVEEDLKANGFDVIVFVPSYDEDNGLITCGNAILSGKKPTSSYKEVIF